MSALHPSFRLQLNQQVVSGLAVVGKFDGRNTALACATSSDNIIIHSPHNRDANSQIESRPLSVNRRISALGCGPLAPDGRDVLLIGQHIHLLAYDVESNQDLFFKDIPDGVNAVCCHTVSRVSSAPMGLVGRPSVASPSSSSSLAMVGGNCSIQGFSTGGVENFWTVCPDNVTSLASRICVPSGSSQPRSELLIACEDGSLRIAHGEVVITELHDDVITGIAPLFSTSVTSPNNSISPSSSGQIPWSQCFAFISASASTVGVYHNDRLLWKVRTPSKPTSVAGTRARFQFFGQLCFLSLFFIFVGGDIHFFSGRSAQLLI